VIGAAREVMDALKLPLTFQHLDAGFETFEKTGVLTIPFRVAARFDFPPYLNITR